MTPDWAEGEKCHTSNCRHAFSRRKLQALLVFSALAVVAFLACMSMMDILGGDTIGFGAGPLWTRAIPTGEGNTGTNDQSPFVRNKCK